MTDCYMRHLCKPVSFMQLVKCGRGSRLQSIGSCSTVNRAIMMESGFQMPMLCGVINLSCWKDQRLCHPPTSYFLCSVLVNGRHRNHLSVFFSVHIYITATAEPRFFRVVGIIYRSILTADDSTTITIGERELTFIAKVQHARFVLQ